MAEDFNADGNGVEHTVSGEGERFVTGSGLGDPGFEIHSGFVLEAFGNDPDRLREVVISDEFRGGAVGGEAPGFETYGTG